MPWCVSVDTFKPQQTSAWKYLKYELARNKQSQVRWCCWPKKVDSSAASRLAQLMLKSQDKFDSATAQIEEYERTCTDREEEETLPSCDKPQDWTEFSQWKHPELGLNLLQLAIVCGHLSGVKYLWQDRFIEKPEYQDASSRLVNHPWHLIFALGTEYEKELPIEEADVEVFLEEGEVDLKAELLRKWPTTKRLVKRRADIVLAGSKLGLDWMQYERGITLYFNVWCMIGEKLANPLCEASTVECLWTLVWDNPLYSEKLDICLIDMAHEALNLEEESEGQVREWRTLLAEDCLILICQLWFTIAKDDNLYYFGQIFRKALKCGVPLTKAASFLNSSDRRLVHGLVTLDPNPYDDSHSKSLFDDFVDVTSGVTSLMDLCVHCILRAVNGDARKVWKKSGLPRPLKTLFHVPFQSLLDQITGVSSAGVISDSKDFTNT